MALNLKALQDAYDKSTPSDKGGNVSWFKMKKGTNYIHVLPPWSGGDVPFADFWLHFVNDEQNNSFAFQCAKRFEEGRCVMCDKSKALLNSSHEQDKKLGSDLKASHRFLYNVCNQEAQVSVLSVGPKCHKEILFEIKEDVAAGFDPTSYKGGVMIRVERTDQGSWNTTDYKARAERNRVDLPDDLMNNHANITQLDKIYDAYTNVELQQVLNGNFDPKGIRNKKELTSTISTVGEPPKATVITVVQPAQQVVAASPIVQVAPIAPIVQQPVQQTIPVQPLTPTVSATRKPSIDEARRILAGT